MKHTILMPVLAGIALLQLSACDTAGDIKSGESSAKQSDSRNESVVEVQGREGATIKFVYTRHQTPLAHIVFFPGGIGHMGVSETRSGVAFGNYRQDLTINTRKMLNDHGFSVAIVDTPSDRGPNMGGFRESTEYGKDMSAIISRLKNDADVPVWLYGHSRGTVAAAAQAINLGPTVVSGVVLSASIAAGRRTDTYVTEMPLEKITVPVLVMSAANDRCDEWTPKAAASVVAEKLVNSPQVSLIYPEGARDVGDVCKALSAHSYWGIQDKVTNSVSDFIKKNL